MTRGFTLPDVAN